MSLLITDAGIAASIEAGNLGISYKITEISIGTEGYIPTADQEALRNEVERKAITRGTVIGNGQLHFETVWNDGTEFEGKEIGYWLETGVLFAVDSRDGEVITYKRKDTIVTEAVEMNLAASSIENITVELLGQPYATEQVAGIAKIATSQQVNEGLDDNSFLTVKKLVLSLGVTHVIDKLVSNLWLKLAAKIFPVGAAIPWFTDVAPDGFAIMKNQAFDIGLYPELAKVFTDGVIPDMRGCGVMGKEDGETVGVFEEGQVKQHGHNGSTVSSTNLGSKTTTTDSHYHAVDYSTRATKENAANDSGGWNYMFDDGTKRNTSTDSHAHSVSIGSHTHNVTIALFGALKNTINHRKVNWIVRMA